MTALASGARVGPYEVLECVGYGASGIVYRAHDPGLQRLVAVKVFSTLTLADPQTAERFQREAQLWARLEHPSIVPLYLAGVDGDRPFIAMRYIGGGTLDARLRVGSLPAAEALAVLADVAAALDFAHAHQVVHRDVKPANVLLDETTRALLSDFGIARTVRLPGDGPGTQDTVGTPLYMAPEQARSQSPTPLADIYSLGCLAYEVLVGVPPFRGQTALDVVMQHVSSSPVPPRHLRPEIPEHAEEAILRALAKDPQERWPTAALFVRALRAPLDLEAVGTVSIPGYRTPRPVALAPSRSGLALHMPWIALAGIVLATLIGLVLQPIARRAWNRFSQPAAVSAPHQPIAGSDRPLADVQRWADEGAYAEALERLAQLSRAEPSDTRLGALDARLRRAWEAEKRLGVWRTTRPH
jgi:serine/threonine protein kinase